MSILDGKPLIYYTIIEALKSKVITDLIVSSDDNEIIEYSKKEGVMAPFYRPKKLSSDYSLSSSVMLHALDFMENRRKKKYDSILMLQPTSPFRKISDLKSCYKILKKDKLDAVWTVTKVSSKFHPIKILKIEKI